MISLVIQHLLSNHRIQIFTYVRLSAQSDQFHELQHIISFIPTHAHFYAL